MTRRSITGNALRGFLAAAIGFGALVVAQGQDGGQWKTAFFKRGYCGTMQVAWAGSPDATLRVPVYLPFGGTKVRLHLESSTKDDFVLENLVLVKAADGNGHGEGPEYPILFSGSPKVEIKARSKELVSDEIDVPLTEGRWLLQQKYGTPQCLYAYDVDGYFGVVADSQPQFKKGAWAGNVSRLEVFTADSRPVTVCYGDSITQGYGATAGSGNRYPHLLGQRIKQPVLNLGVNGDLAVSSRNLSSRIRNFGGVKTVIFLMGINDIISGRITQVDEFTEEVSRLIEAAKKDGLQLYLGTITPAKGYEKFDADPARETLRQEINAWIREQALADGVIDFDEALRDPADPAKMKDEYQSDRLHPNDAGNQKMAEAAAAKLSS